MKCLFDILIKIINNSKSLGMFKTSLIVHNFCRGESWEELSNVIHSITCVVCRVLCAVCRVSCAACRVSCVVSGCWSSVINVIRVLR